MKLIKNKNPFSDVSYLGFMGGGGCKTDCRLSGFAGVRCCPLAVCEGRAAAVHHFSSATGSICLSRQGLTKQWELHRACC